VAVEEGANKGWRMGKDRKEGKRLYEKGKEKLRNFQKSAPMHIIYYTNNEYHNARRD